MPELRPLLEKLNEEPPEQGRRTYRARDRALGRTVRVVTLDDGVLVDAPSAKALLREAQAHARLHHPHVLAVYGVNLDSQRITLELEDFEGQPLTTSAALRSIPELLTILGASLEALAHAHERAVLHGQLSLERIEVDARGDVRVRGFSLALAAGQTDVDNDELLDFGAACPEVSLGGAYGPLSELFFWGRIAYEALTHQDPFAPTATQGNLERVRHYHPPPPLSVRREIPPSVSVLIEKCLAKLPSDRPKSARALATEWNTLTAEHLETTPLPSRTGLSRPSATWLGTALAFLSLAALALFWFFKREESSLLPQPLSKVPIEATDAPDAPGAHLARLRVVAHPWARVFVDGDERETTPFAAPIIVSPGVHTIRLEHPNARPEERTVDVAQGQTALIDVVLNVERPLPPRADQIAPIENSP